MAMTLKTWADIHRDLRESKDWTQQQAAVALGISISTVSHWEQGKAEPNLRQLRRAAEVYGPAVWDALHKRALFNGSILSSLRMGELVAAPA